jgi:hypothetical protein
MQLRSELLSNLLVASAMSVTCFFVAWYAYRAGKNNAAVEFTIGNVLDRIDRPLTEEEILDELHEQGITAIDFGNLHPALNRLEKTGLISSYMLLCRKYYLKQPSGGLCEQSPSQ